MPAPARYAIRPALRCLAETAKCCQAMPSQCCQCGTVWSSLWMPKPHMCKPDISQEFTYIWAKCKSNMFPLHSAVSICCAWAFGSLRMVQVKRNFKTIQSQLAVSSTGWLSTSRNAFRDRIGDTGIPKMLQDCKEVVETSSWKKLRGSNYVNQVYHNHTIWQQLQDFRVGYRLAFGK